MVDYEVIVLTGSLGFATTFDNIYIKLVGLNGSSKRKCLWSCMPSFYSGAVSLKYPSLRSNVGHACFFSPTIKVDVS